MTITMLDGQGIQSFLLLSLKKQDYPALNFLPNQTSATSDGAVLGRIETRASVHSAEPLRFLGLR